MNVGAAPIGPAASRSSLDRRWPWFGRLLDRLGIFGQSLWLLYFKPSLFMQAFTGRRRFALNALFAWTYAIGHLVDAQYVHSSRGRGSIFSSSWPEQWGFLLLGGMVLGLLIYRFGGWWYELRLWWSGVNPIDEDKARSVYLASSQIQALPTILWTLGETLFYESPIGSMTSASLWMVPMIVFPFWSIRASHVAVQSVFQGNRTALRIWFLIIPLLGVFLPFIVGGIMMAFDK